MKDNICRFKIIMGSITSKDQVGEYHRHLPQEDSFVSFCRQTPDSFSLRLEWDEDDSGYKWHTENGDSIDQNIKLYKFNGASYPYNKIVEIEPKDFNLNCQESLFSTAGAHCGTRINHLLDGYSWLTLLKINADHGKLLLHLNNHPMEADEILFQKEEVTGCLKQSNLKPGLFDGKISFWNKAFRLGKLPGYIRGNLTVERNTGHQPIYFPAKNTTLVAGTVDHGAASIILRDNFIQAEEEEAWKPKVPNKKYLGTHPQYDPTGKKYMFYHFSYGLSKKQTNITFFQYGEGEDGILDSSKVKYRIKDRVLLHMFGYTEHYFVLFANLLSLKKSGLGVVAGKPLVREMDDQFISNLVIHLIPRPEYQNRETFSVNTKLQGYSYHTINCFERKDGAIIIDAFVSTLNPEKEASQFELGDNDVHDINDDSYRFVISTVGGEESGSSDEESGSNQIGNTCQLKIISSLIDSSIDFHAINPNLGGKEYHYFWVVAHRRERNPRGEVESVISTLHKVHIPGDDLTFNSAVTVTNTRSSSDWNKCDYCYLRNPVFVPNKNPKSEDDGNIFVWSYQFSREDDKESPQLSSSSQGSQSQNPTNLLIFQAAGLQTMVVLTIPSMFSLPYPIHSSCYVYSKDDSFLIETNNLSPPTTAPPLISKEKSKEVPEEESSSSPPVIVNQILQDTIPTGENNTQVPIDRTGSVHLWNQLSIDIDVNLDSSADQVVNAKSGFLSRLLNRIARRKQEITKVIDEEMTNIANDIRDINQEIDEEVDQVGNDISNVANQMENQVNQEMDQVENDISLMVNQTENDINQINQEVNQIGQDVAIEGQNIAEDTKQTLLLLASWKPPSIQAEIQIE